MMDKPVFFGDAIKKATEIVSKASLPASVAPLVIRDIHGRISIALEVDRSAHEDIISNLQAELVNLGKYAASPSVLCTDDFFEPEVIFRDPTIVEYLLPGTEFPVRLLERQVTGQDWLQDGNNHESRKLSPRTPHVVFFGIKGGVGRSTASAVLAYYLAKAGKQVLLIDLDLESPGLSGLLLPSDRRADFGVVDWLQEDAVGQSADVCDRMVSVSPLSDNLRKEIRIVAAVGNSDTFYLDKLSRAYADVSEGLHPRRFSDRIARLVNLLEDRENPDIVLIDSRAGLHDLAAVSVVSLASTALLFATDTMQGWQGYHALFAHWQSRPSVARHVRERLKVVSALFPESDQVSHARQFLERSYTLFAETLYDEVTPGGSENADSDLFNFDIEDSSAPHYPLRIKWSNRFQEFDPLLIPDGLFSNDEVRAAYGAFLDGMMQLIEDA